VRLDPTVGVKRAFGQKTVVTEQQVDSPKSGMHRPAEAGTRVVER